MAASNAATLFSTRPSPCSPRCAKGWAISRSSRSWRLAPSASTCGDGDDCIHFHRCIQGKAGHARSEEHTSELQSLMRTSYAVFCLKKKIQIWNKHKQQYDIKEITKH